MKGMKVLKNNNVDKFSDHSLILRHYANDLDSQLLNTVNHVAEQSAFRNMQTPSGGFIRAAMTNCGKYGWISDKSGYRYDKTDPKTNKSWPEMPEVFKTLAKRAANDAGYNNFESNACLINRYTEKIGMSLHQDKDENDFTHPIVSVSLGVSIIFLFGGLTRKEKVMTKELKHGDVVVWGGPDRLRFHGVRPLKRGVHPLVGAARINLTLRRAS